LLKAALTAAGSSLEAEVVTHAGQPFAGFSMQQSRLIPIRGQLWQRCNWDKEFSTLQGKNIRLRFRLTGNAKLYALRID